METIEQQWNGHEQESATVVEWRLEQLLASGFDHELALRLARMCAIDLHALIELVERGCQPPLAARILAPLDDERRPC
jgi:hypothetical protein